MAEIDLIHAGLPWNNPQKITVKADQYISQLVINRGLLNLLSNDFYLDLKTQRINQYIVQLFGPHIADTSIHWTEDGIVDIIKRFLNGELGNYLDSFGLLKDTAFIIPIISAEDFPKNVNRIQSIINNCPKNLNGHTAIFALTPVVNDIEDDITTEENEAVVYNKTIGEYYNKNKSVISSATYESDPDLFANTGCYSGTLNININYKSILLNGFYGGTIILLGNKFFVCEQKYKDGGKSLNTRQTRIFLEQIQKNIDKNTTPQFTITSNGENNTRAVVSFNNCNCDSYIWNLGVTLDSSNVSNSINNPNAPKKRDLAWFFPCNLVDDMVTGNVRYVVADALNDQNFTQSYLTLRSANNTISGNSQVDTWNISTNPEEENIPQIPAVNLGEDYLMLSTAYNSFTQTLFGKYLSEGEIISDSLYEGATLCFWMKQAFYSKNIHEVPIIYNVDSNGNGYYIGLDKVAAIQHGEIKVTQYLDTSFASKKRTDLNNTWNFWSIKVEPISGDTYAFTIHYYNPQSNKDNKQLLPILPSKVTVDNAIKNRLELNYINFNYPIAFFGTPNIRSNAYIRNITLFNSALTNSEIQALAEEEIQNSYNLSEIDISQTFKNGMKGALYVYNTTSMNVIGCKLAKVGSN